MTFDTFITQATLAVLAGGEGSRMGLPKGQLRIGGQPILDHLLDAFAWPGPTLLVTAPGRERPPGAERFAREVVDPVFGAGPLCGLLTALHHATTTLLVVTAVDMPALRSRHPRWLVAALRRRTSAAGVMLERRARGDRWIEPLPAAFRVSLALPAVEDRFAAGERSVRGLASDPAFATVVAPSGWDDTAWANLNTPANFAAYAEAEEPSVV